MHRPLQPPQLSGSSNLARLASINQQLLPRFLPRGTSVCIAEEDLRSQHLEESGSSPLQRRKARSVLLPASVAPAPAPQQQPA
jgi:hypothetical protein